ARARRTDHSRTAAGRAGHRARGGSVVGAWPSKPADAAAFRATDRRTGAIAGRPVARHANRRQRGGTARERGVLRCPAGQHRHRALHRALRNLPLERWRPQPARDRGARGTRPCRYHGAGAARRDRWQAGTRGDRPAAPGSWLSRRVLQQALTASPGRTQRPYPSQDRGRRRPRGVRRRPLHRRLLDAGNRLRRRDRHQPAPARAGRACAAGSLQRELGRPDRRDVRGGRGVSPTAASRKSPRPCRVRQTRGFGVVGKAVLLRGDLPRPQATLDPESLLHSRARHDHRARRGGRPRRGRARAHAIGRQLGQSAGAARWPPQLRTPAARRRAVVRIPARAAAPEGDDDRWRVERRGLDQLRRPLVRDERRDHAWSSRPQPGRPARRDLRTLRVGRNRGHARCMAPARPLAQGEGLCGVQHQRVAL
ncbi:MAG: Cardiolipin synthetase, partial [uncultured Lysobacter sp.]